MKKQGRKLNIPLILLFLTILVGAYFYNRSKQNPCLSKIDYSTINVNAGIDLDSLFASPDAKELEQTLTTRIHRLGQPMGK